MIITAVKEAIDFIRTVMFDSHVIPHLLQKATVLIEKALKPADTISSRLYGRLR